MDEKERHLLYMFKLDMALDGDFLACNLKHHYSNYKDYYQSWQINHSTIYHIVKAMYTCCIILLLVYIQHSNTNLNI